VGDVSSDDVGQGEERELVALGRFIAIAAAVSAIAAVALLLFGGGGGYTVTLSFDKGGQLVRGNPVQTGGQTIGSVRNIALTDDGRVDVTVKVDDLHSPLPHGTRAAIRQLSVSGIANRYVDLAIPPDTGQGKIGDGGHIGGDATRTPVDVDEVFATFDRPTRRALRGFLQGNAASLKGRGKALGRGVHYLNPALSSSSRLFDQLTRDVPQLERTLVDSARVVSTLAQRHDELAALVGDARDTTRALGNQKSALAESVARLPPFMRRANTTFVNLRAALDDVDPLVDASTPAVRRLRPFLAQARGFAADARPTLADLRTAIRRRGRGNDLTELVRALPPLADIATVTRSRTFAPGGRRFGVGKVPGAFPQVTGALGAARPVLALGRPYTADFLGWLDDFSSTGGSFDALGAFTRTYASVAENGMGGPPKRGQFKRCPGGADVPLRDGSNVLSGAEQQALGCRESDRAVR
jgi:phospholipid/cholesterol/gamma-HCH transport system substrate-binding protein